MTLTEIKERVHGSRVAEAGYEPHLVDTLDPVHDRQLIEDTLEALADGGKNDVEWGDFRKELLR
ncbi:MAG: hypothetical protein OXC71_10470 [Chloroflexi bacterium]|nr:hypothetical protein [Chloroflexota bacterium]